MKTEQATSAGNCPVDGEVRPLVERLQTLHWHTARKMEIALCAEAADEIARLNELRRSLQAENGDLKQQRNRARLDAEREASKRHATEIARLKDALGEKQARIDSLMLEWCPDEMTPQQIEEWEKAQVSAPGIDDATLAAALKA